jgi:hypothetical protein
LTPTRDWHNLGITNSTKSSSTLFSINYFDHQGLVKYTDFQRFNIRLNSTYKLWENRIRVGENLPLEEYVNVSNTEFTRDELLSKFSQDFERAAALLPYTQTDLGRVTKYAAYAYVAKINLYRAYKQNDETHAVTGIDETLLQKAVDYCDSVALGGFGLLPDFQNLCEVEHEHGVETVFGTEYSIDDGTINGRINWSNLLNTPRGPAYGGGRTVYRLVCRGKIR